MRIIHRSHDFKADGQSPKIGMTMGNFDGVHRGHQRFLKQVKKDCVERGLKLAVVTFVPHPMQVLVKESENFLINTPDERRELLKEIGVDYLYEIDFNHSVSQMQPGAFLDKYIFSESGVSAIYLGHDFAFGVEKRGNFAFIKEYCRNLGIEVQLHEEYKSEFGNVSSTAIRRSIKKGQIHIANRLLSRDYFLSGVVVKGVGRGSLIGHPTVNLEFPREMIIPQKGIYFSRTLYKGKRYQSITNIGNRPTFGDGLKQTVETHILNFSDFIYGENVSIYFLERLRDEKKFSSAKELAFQIEQDIRMAQEYFCI